MARIENWSIRSVHSLNSGSAEKVVRSSERIQSASREMNCRLQRDEVEFWRILKTRLSKLEWQGRSVISRIATIEQQQQRPTGDSSARSLPLKFYCSFQRGATDSPASKQEGRDTHAHTHHTHTPSASCSGLAFSGFRFARPLAGSLTLVGEV